VVKAELFMGSGDEQPKKAGRRQASSLSAALLGTAAASWSSRASSGAKRSELVFRVLDDENGVQGTPRIDERHRGRSSAWGKSST